jgi:uncharacterized protein (TIGR03437 family)
MLIRARSEREPPGTENLFMSMPNLLATSVLILCGSFLAHGQPGYTIHTFAGGGLPEGVAGTSANLGDVSGVAVDSQGSVYIALGKYSAVFRLDPTGYLTRVAGNGTAGKSGDGGPALNARISYQDKIAVDSAGNLYIAEFYYGVVRKVSNGMITTVAGGGSSLGDGGPATSANLSFLQGIAVDGRGNIYVADTSRNRVRRVSGGVIDTVAGTGAAGSDGDGGPAAAAKLSSPAGVAVDADGDLYIMDVGNNRVRKVSNGIITTLAGTGERGSGIDGPAAEAKLALDFGGDIALDASGNVYITDYRKVRKIAGGTITTVAGVGPAGVGWDYDIGDNGPALSAKFSILSGLAVGTDGSLYVTDEGYGSPRVRKLSKGVVTSVAGGGPTPGDKRPANREMLRGVSALAIDAGGGLVIAEKGANRVRVVRAGMIDAVAGNGKSGPPSSWNGVPAADAILMSPSELAVDPAGAVYTVIRNNTVVKISNGTVTGPVAPGETATITGLAADGAGNVYASESLQHRVQRISGGAATVVAGTGAAGYSGDQGTAANAQLNSPEGLALDSAGSLYIADSSNRVIRKVSNGAITTAAGPFGAVGSVAVDSAGSLYATGLFVVHKVVNGVASTIAGGGTEYSEGGPATGTAFLGGPFGLAVDASGKVYIGDSVNNRVRVLIPSHDADGKPRLVAVSAATNEFGPLAAGSIATVYGDGFASSAETAGPVPQTSLSGASVSVRDSGGVERPAPLFYVSPGQINFQVPSAAAPGLGALIVKAASGTVLTTSLDIARIWPGVFTMNQDSLVAANVVRVRPDNSQSVEPVYRLDNGAVAANPVDLGPATDRVYLTLYGTGIRQASAGAVTVTIGGVSAPVSYAGPQGAFAGEDQINVLAPRSLAGRGPVPVLVNVEGYASNSAYIEIR